MYFSMIKNKALERKATKKTWTMEKVWKGKFRGIKGGCKVLQIIMNKWNFILCSLLRNLNETMKFFELFEIYQNFCKRAFNIFRAFEDFKRKLLELVKLLKLSSF